MFTEEEAEKEEKAEEEEEEEDAEGWEEEEEVRGSLSIGNPFSFVIRSRKTLQERLAVERRISLKRCYKTVGPRWVHRRRESSGLYKRWQPLYDEISRTVIPRVEFVRGIPYDFSDHIVEVNEVVHHFRQPWVLMRKIWQ
jgi:hypothetical protein